MDIINFFDCQNLSPTKLDDNNKLMNSAKSGDISQIASLIEKGIHLNVVNNHGQTALMLAASYNQIATVKYLIKQDADVNLANNQGQTALILAAFCGHLAIAECLIQQGAKIDLVNHHGQTAFMLALFNGHTAIAHRLWCEMTPAERLPFANTHPNNNILNQVFFDWYEHHVATDLNRTLLFASNQNTAQTKPLSSDNNEDKSKIKNRQ